MSNNARQLATPAAAGAVGHAVGEHTKPIAATAAAFGSKLGAVRQQAVELPAVLVQPQRAQASPALGPAAFAKPTAPAKDGPAAERNHGITRGHDNDNSAHRIERGARGRSSLTNAAGSEVSVAAQPTAPSQMNFWHANSPAPANVHQAVQQIGRVANVNQLSNGQFEFRLVMPNGSLAGMEIHVTTVGANRVSLSVRNSRGRIKGDALTDLVQRMGENGVTVVGVEIE